MATDKGENLLNPGDTPHEKAQFLVFCAAVIRSVSKYSEILRLSIASAHNDHRLGATKPRRRSSPFSSASSSRTFSSRSKKARPRVASRAGCSRRAFRFCPGFQRMRAIATAPARSLSPEINSSSAVGSSANIAGANTVLNTIVAESLDFMATKLEAETKAGKDLNKAVQDLLPSIIREHKKVLFNGNGYAEEWHSEAEKRGLPNLKSTVDVLPVVIRKDTTDLFVKYKVYSEKELNSRFNILSEAYVKAVNIEALTALMMARTFILPAALRFQKELGELVAAAKAAGINSGRHRAALHDHQRHFGIGSHDRYVGQGRGASRRWRRIRDAKHMREAVLPAMAEVRKVADKLEGIIPDDLWPLPTYREMLFIK